MTAIRPAHATGGPAAVRMPGGRDPAEAERAIPEQIAAAGQVIQGVRLHRRQRGWHDIYDARGTLAGHVFRERRRADEPMLYHGRTAGGRVLPVRLDAPEPVIAAIITARTGQPAPPPPRGPQQRKKDHAAMTTPTADQIRDEARLLAAGIDELTEWWDAVEEVDTTLGAEVQEKGERLMLLAGQLAAAIGSGDQAAGLRQLSARLAEETGYYEGLDEHDTNASIGIFDQLGGGIALVLRAAAWHAGVIRGQCTVTQPHPPPAGTVMRGRVS